MAAIHADVRQRALAATRTLARLATLRAAYVFGSHANGRADEWSDIDVAAFLDGIETWNLERRAKAMALVMEEAGSDVEAHLFPASTFDKPEPGSFAADILRHGIRIV